MLLSLLSMLLMVQTAAPERAAAPVVDTPAAGTEVVADGESRRGAVELECTVLPEGQVSDCIIRSETPQGLGFGAAAVSAARRARLSPESLRGAAPGARVRFTIRFRLED